MSQIDPWAPPAGEAPLVLALDTSSKVGGVALSRGFEPLGEETWLAGGSQTSQVLPAVVRLCERAGVGVPEVGVVVVATGPGSFTGLRVGASLGKGLVAALGRPLVGVPTLDVLAYQHRTATGRIVALVDAGRGQVYAGTYRSGARGPARAGDFQVFSEEELAQHVASLGGNVTVVGEMPSERAQVLAALPKVRVASPAAALRRPMYLAELGYARLLEHGPSDAAALQPLYLKRG